MDELDCISHVILDVVKFLLHAAGPCEVCVSFKQTAHEMGFLGQVRNESGHEVHCSKQALEFLLVFWSNKRCNFFHCLWTQLDSLRRDDASEVLDLLFLKETLAWVELESCLARFFDSFQ